ncbi:hypothetical protein [Actinomadura rupiterrae]|uniref:hypothetical protein n=1 Tax=Actinomadura rupiterrae TaxID=559627 RepID=UPI0020A4CD38|nr:hypothetical protein [Actinomadura rupiterrae]MCP2341250.1 hypothetical protein [Actinomadura rupiterrae]
MRTKRIASAAAAVAAGLATGVLPGLTAASAHADPCLVIKGGVEAVVADGQHIGIFYQGFDQCNNTTYAEFHFDSSDTSSRVISTYPYTDGRIQITRVPQYNQNITNYGLPNGALYWDAGSLSTVHPDGEQFSASAHFYFWTHSKIAECFVEVSWDYAANRQVDRGNWCHDR